MSDDELIEGDDFHYSIVQILPYRKLLFWIQERFADSFGNKSLGLFLVDEDGEVVKIEGNGLAGVRKALESFWDADA